MSAPIPHEWVLVAQTEKTRTWRCSCCKGEMRSHRGLLQSMEDFEVTPPKEVSGGCDVEKRIAYLDAELKRLREKVKS